MSSRFSSPLYLFAVLAAPLVMPEQIPSRYLDTQGFVSFGEPGNSSAPLYNTMEVNGATARAAQVKQIFSETTYAYLPQGTLIFKSKDSAGREIWEYPIGTEVAHEIMFNDTDHQLFEIRFLKKVADQQWDFASYSPTSFNPQNKGAPLKRNHYTGAEPLSLTLQLTNGTKPKIELTKLNLGSCRNCHLFNSAASYQYTSPGNAGPCGFTPNNGPGIQTWIDQYRIKYGHTPFGN